MSLVAELPALDPIEIGMAYLAIGDSNCLPIYLASYLAIYLGIIQSSNKQPVQIPLQIPYGAPPSTSVPPLDVVHCQWTGSGCELHPQPLSTPRREPEQLGDSTVYQLL